MKDFVKMTLATIAGLFLFGFVAMFMMFAMIGALAAAGDTQPVIPREGVLQINMSTMTLAEQTTEADPFASISGEQVITAEVPAAEMSTYSIDLRSMTQSHGSFTFEFVRYEDCPPAAQEKAIAEAKALAEQQ